MSEKGRAGVSFLFAGSVVWWLLNQHNKPRVTYKWLSGNQLAFNFNKGSKGVNGVAELSPAGIVNNVTWIGNYAFSVISEADSIRFQLNDADGKILFNKTVMKEA